MPLNHIRQSWRMGLSLLTNDCAHYVVGLVALLDQELAVAQYLHCRCINSCVRDSGRFVTTHPEVATECSPVLLIGLLEVDVLLTSVRSVHGIFATHTIRIPSDDSVVLYLNHLDGLTLCKRGIEYIFAYCLRVSSEEEVSTQSSYVPAVLADEVETVSERRLNRRSLSM